MFLPDKRIFQPNVDDHFFLWKKSTSFNLACFSKLSVAYFQGHNTVGFLEINSFVIEKKSFNKEFVLI